MPPTTSSGKSTVPAAARPAQARITPVRRVFLRRLVLVAVAVNLALIGLALRSIAHSKLRYEAQAETTTQNLSRVLAGHIADEVSRIDLTVLTVVDEIEQQLASAEGINPETLNTFI